MLIQHPFSVTLFFFKAQGIQGSVFICINAVKIFKYR